MDKDTRLTDLDQSRITPGVGVKVESAPFTLHTHVDVWHNSLLVSVVAVGGECHSGHAEDRFPSLGSPKPHRGGRRRRRWKEPIRWQYPKTVPAETPTECIV